MGVSGYAILSGLLQGAGGAATGIGNAITEGEKQRAERDRLAIEQQRADQQMEMQRNSLAQNQAQFEATQKAADAARYVDVPASMGGGRTAKELLPFLFAKADADAKRLDETGKLSMAREAILNQPARPDVPVPAEGAMYSAAETLPGKAATPKNAVLAALLGQPNADALLKQMYPEDNEAYIVHGGNAAGSPTLVVNKRTGEVTQSIPGNDPGMKPKFTTNTINTQEGVFREVVDERGQVVGRERVGSPVQQPRDPTQPSGAVIYNKAVENLLELRRAGVPETDPRYAEARDRVNMLKPVMIAEGGNLGGAGGGPPLATGGPKTPGAGAQAHMAQLDYLSGAFGNIVDKAQKPEIGAALGGAFTNPVGAGKRGLEALTGIPTLTDTQRAFFADKAIVLTEARKLMFGLRQTAPEIAALAPALPADSDPGFVQKMQAWKTWADNSRAALNNVTSGAGLRVPPAPGASPTGWGKATVVP